MLITWQGVDTGVRGVARSDEVRDNACRNPSNKRTSEMSKLAKHVKRLKTQGGEDSSERPVEGSALLSPRVEAGCTSGSAGSSGKVFTPSGSLNSSRRCASADLLHKGEEPWAQGTKHRLRDGVRWTDDGCSPAPCPFAGGRDYFCFIEAQGPLCVSVVRVVTFFGWFFKEKPKRHLPSSPMRPTHVWFEDRNLPPICSAKRCPSPILGHEVDASGPSPGEVERLGFLCFHSEDPSTRIAGVRKMGGGGRVVNSSNQRRARICVS